MAGRWVWGTIRRGFEADGLDVVELDDGVACLLGERFEICRQIAIYKRINRIPMMQPTGRIGTSPVSRPRRRGGPAA